MLKYFIMAIGINIILTALFVAYVMVPLNKAAKGIAITICRAQGIECVFK